MISLTAQTKTKIYGTKNCWSLALNRDRGKIDVRECNVYLEIQGNNKQGYNLVISPDGFFPADYWYQSKQEAMDEAEELFNISHDKWSETRSS